jgi:hypothetical protein
MKTVQEIEQLMKKVLTKYGRSGPTLLIEVAMVFHLDAVSDAKAMHLDETVRGPRGEILELVSLAEPGQGEPAASPPMEGVG